MTSQERESEYREKIQEDIKIAENLKEEQISIAVQSLLGGSLAGRHYSRPPEYWRRWTLPSEPLQIDYELMQYLDDSGSRKAFRAKNDLEKDDILCPFYFIRIQIIEALEISFGRNIDVRLVDRVSSVNSLKRFRKNIKKLDEGLDKVFGDPEAMMALVSHPLGDHDLFFLGLNSLNPQPMKSDFYDRVPYFQMKEQLSGLAGEAAKKLDELKKKDGAIGNIIERTFVTYIGQSWLLLTGKSPTHSNRDFQNFVSASIASSGISLEPERFVGSIRAAIDEARAVAGEDAFKRPSENEQRLRSIEELKLHGYRPIFDEDSQLGGIERIQGDET